jgi:hypothetical protein
MYCQTRRRRRSLQKTDVEVFVPISRGGTVSLSSFRLYLSARKTTLADICETDRVGWSKLCGPLDTRVVRYKRRKYAFRHSACPYFCT